MIDEIDGDPEDRLSMRRLVNLAKLASSDNLSPIAACRRPGADGGSHGADKRHAAARLGDSATCVGPRDTIAKGSATVLIGGQPAARMGDSCAHGGTITLGCPTVLIGG